MSIGFDPHLAYQPEDTAAVSIEDEGEEKGSAPTLSEEESASSIESGCCTDELNKSVKDVGSVDSAMVDDNAEEVRAEKNDDSSE